jgi:hypothetical protein
MRATALPNKAGREKIDDFQLSGSSQREFSVDVGFRSRLAVRASGTAGLGAGAERLVNDGLDGARAAAAFRAATEAAIDLLGIAGKVFGGAHGAADVVVGDQVAGTDNHENSGASSVMRSHRYLTQARDAKGKTGFSSDSKLIPNPDWNDSKNPYNCWPAWPFISTDSLALIAADSSTIATAATTIATTGVP